MNFHVTDFWACSDRKPCLISLHNPSNNTGPNKEPMLKLGIKQTNEWKNKTFAVINLLRFKKKNKIILRNRARWIIGLIVVAVILFWGQEHRE